MALKKRKLIKWLVDHGFEELSAKATGLRQYRHRHSGVVVTVPVHGQPELSKKHLGMLLRQLETAGFDKETVRKELA